MTAPTAPESEGIAADLATGASASSGGGAADVKATERARRRFYAVWAVVGAAIVVGIIIYVLKLFAIPVGMAIWTAIIVFCLRGPVSFLERKGASRLVGTVLAYLLLICVLALVAFVVFSPVFGIGEQFDSLVSGLPDYVDRLAVWAQDLYGRYADAFDAESVRNALNGTLSTLSNWAAEIASAGALSIVAVGTSVVNSVISIGFALVVAFWILMELPALGRECMRLVGDRRREDAEMLHITFTRVVGGYLKATFLQCAIIGIACGVLFTICGIPNAAALGVIAGVLNIIPIVGPWLGGAVAALVGLFAGFWVALAAVVGTIVIQQFVYTFISPRLMADSVDVHPAVTFFALMAGSAIGGAISGFGGSLVGMLLSIPAVAVAKSVFVYYFEKRTGRRIVAEDGVLFKGASRDGAAPDPLADATAPHPAAAAIARRRPGRINRSRTDPAPPRSDAEGESDAGGLSAAEADPSRGKDQEEDKRR